MRFSHPRLPHNTIAATLLLLSLIFGGGGLLNWHKAWITKKYEHELFKRDRSQVVNIPLHTPEILRRREHIKIFKEPIAPVTVQPSDKTPVLSHVATTQPVVFITIDDGITKDINTSEFMQARKVPITAFLTIHDIKEDFAFFTALAKQGTTIQNHTLMHPSMPMKPFEEQKHEICGTSDILGQQYGQRPTLFRPPYGEYNDDTLKAAAACGIKATITWNVVVQNGALQYQQQSGLKPGDIILLHYKPELKQDLQATFRSIHEQGMQIGRLEDWIK